VYYNTYGYTVYLYPLQLIDKVQSGFAGSIGKVCASTRSEVQDIITIGQLSLSQQIQHKLF